MGGKLIFMRSRDQTGARLNCIREKRLNFSVVLYRVWNGVYLVDLYFIFVTAPQNKTCLLAQPEQRQFQMNSQRKV